MQIRPIEIATKFRLPGVRAAAVAVVALACAFLSAQQVNAQIDHSTGFADHSDLTPVASGGGFFGFNVYFPTYPGGTFARLTSGAQDSGGGIWGLNKQNITNFTNSFTLSITAGTTRIGDGMMFVIQNDLRGTAALGCRGGGLGYGADNPVGMCAEKITKSVGVKFDVFKGNDCEPSDNQTGLFVDGDSPTCANPGTEDQVIDLDGSGVDLRAGNQLQITMGYDGTTLNVTITDTVTGNSASQSYTVNIPEHVGDTMAWVGFTGATGGATSIDDIQTWAFLNP